MLSCDIGWFRKISMFQITASRVRKHMRSASALSRLACARSQALGIRGRSALVWGQKGYSSHARASDLRVRFGRLQIQAQTIFGWSQLSRDFVFGQPCSQIQGVLSRGIHVFHLGLPWPILGSYLDLTWTLPGSYLDLTWMLPVSLCVSCFVRLGTRLERRIVESKFADRGQTCLEIHMLA